MNVPATSNTASTQGSAKTDGGRPADANDTRPDDATRSRFESALRARERDGQGQGDGQDDTPGEDTMSALAAGVAHLPLPLHAVKPGETGARAAASQPMELSAPKKAIEAALNANVATPVTAVGEADPAALWEIAVREPNAVAVDVKAFRAEKSAYEATAAWSLSVSSPTVDSDVLARHTPKLQERLRKQGAQFSHVRVEEKTKQEE